MRSWHQWCHCSAPTSFHQLYSTLFSFFSLHFYQFFCRTMTKTECLGTFFLFIWWLSKCVFSPHSCAPTTDTLWWLIHMRMDSATYLSRSKRWLSWRRRYDHQSHQHVLHQKLSLLCLLVCCRHLVTMWLRQHVVDQSVLKKLLNLHVIPW